MITVYLLENCRFCLSIYKYIKDYPSRDVILIYFSKLDLKKLKTTDDYLILNKFPTAFLCSPKKNGMPVKNAKSISGSKKILTYLKTNNLNNFGTTGNVLDINYPQGIMTNIHQRNHTCFNSGNSCHVMDRPYGQCDNLALLQGQQNLNNKFGMTTPGTPEWKQERIETQKQQRPKPIIKNQKQNTLMNEIGINSPMNYSNNNLNKTNCNYGEYVSAPINSNAPFLTYGAGSTTYSRQHGQEYYPTQNPIKIQNGKNAYMNEDIKTYLKNNPSLKLLNNGINKYGDKLVQTAFNSSQGDSGVAQLWEPNQFKCNGNCYGKKSPKVEKKKKSTKEKKKNTKVEVTSPLGIKFKIK